MGNRKDVSNEAMLALREQGKSNREIAEHFNVTPETVRNRIGAQPKDITLQLRQKQTTVMREKLAHAKQKKKAEKPVEKTPVAPQKAPSEPPKPVEVKEVKEAPATPQKRKIITTDRLFDFAICSAWSDSLDTLAKLAMPEPWAFKNPPETYKKPDTLILEQYIIQTFRFRVQEYNATTDNPDAVIHMRGKFCCFHTGLYDRNLQGIYMYFEQSRPGTRQPWFFVRFMCAQHERLHRVHPLPEHRTLGYDLTCPFDPDKPIRTNFSHITERADRLSRFPEALRGYWNLPLLLETAIDYARRKVRIEPSVAVAVARINEFHWLLPLYITNPDTPDAVAMMEDVGEYYHCRTCLTLDQAYMYARNNGRPTASWLTTSLDTDGGGESKGVTPTYGGEIRPHAESQTGAYGARRL